MRGVAVTVAVATLVFLVARKRRQEIKSRIIFLGSGCSGGTPIALCILGLIPGRPSNGCDVCRSAYQNPTHPNNRRNPCLLIQNADRTCNTLIDCGKTFREAALTFFPQFGVRGIDNVILTHEHADATFGLDEIRVVQYVSKTSPLRSNPPSPVTAAEYSVGRRLEVSRVVDGAIACIGAKEGDKSVQSRSEKPAEKEQTAKTHPLAGMYDDVTVHCMERTMNNVKTSFPYLVSKGKGTVPRFVSQLSFDPFELDVAKPFHVKNFFKADSDMEVIPLPVEHGADFLCAGFQFGRKDVVVYISDVSRILDSTMEHLRRIPEIAIFVVDALRPLNYEKATRPMVHFDLPDALDSIRQLGKPPVRTFLVGLGHEFDYYSTNETLSKLPREVYGLVECAYDGLVIDLDL